MNYFALITLQLAAIGALAQAPAPKPAPAEPIVWSAARPLTPADFQGRAAPGEPMAALTSTDMNASAACRDFVFTGTVRAVFNPSKSWIRNPKTITPALLAHEQLHFDLAELHARRLRQKLALFKLKADCNKLQPAFDNLTKPAYNEWYREDAKYDQETNHGLNAAKQAYWAEQVRQKLEQLQEFAE